MGDKSQAYDKALKNAGYKDRSDLPRIRGQHQLAWLAPNELFQKHLNLLTYSDGRSIRDELSRIREGELFEREVLGRTKQTPEDVAMYKEMLGEWSTARQKALSLAEEEFRKSGVEGGWIGYGRRSPFHDEELIPPQFWSFLKFDRVAMTAVNERHGLEFSGIRCLILGDIPEPWLGLALFEIDEAEAKAREEFKEKQNTIDRSNQNILDREKKLPLYNRVFIAYEELEQKDKDRITYRGGKTELAKIIAGQIPDARFSSIERELRNVLKEKGLT
jgi:hypothetical protein